MSHILVSAPVKAKASVAVSPDSAPMSTYTATWSFCRELLAVIATKDPSINNRLLRLDYYFSLAVSMLGYC